MKSTTISFNKFIEIVYVPTLDAKACWAPNQYYGVFEWVNGANGMIKLDSYKKYDKYEDYYADVASYLTHWERTEKVL